MSLPRGADAASSIDLSKRDLTLDLARVFAVLLVVVIHLLEVGVGTGPHGLDRSAGRSSISPGSTRSPGSSRSCRCSSSSAGSPASPRGAACVRRGGRRRRLRHAPGCCGSPSPPSRCSCSTSSWSAARPLIGVDPKLLGPVVLGAGSPLWFLAAYGLCQAVVPFAVHWHLRAPEAHPARAAGRRDHRGCRPLQHRQHRRGAAQPVLRLGAHPAARLLVRRRMVRPPLLVAARARGTGELGDAVPADDLGAVLPRHADQPQSADRPADRARSLAGLRAAAAAPAARAG